MQAMCSPYPTNSWLRIDRRAGEVRLSSTRPFRCAVQRLDTPFLLVTALPWGLGSNDIGLDRGQSGESHLVEFRRVGARVLLVEDNTKFRAVSGNPDEALSVRQA